MKDAAKFIFNYLKKNAVIIIISDLLGWKDEWEDVMETLNTRFDVICIMVRDPRDKTLPVDVGEVVIQDPKTGKTLLIEPELIKHSYESIVKEQEEKIKKTLFKANVDFVDITTDESFVKPILNLFLRRAKRWR